MKQKRNLKGESSEQGPRAFLEKVGHREALEEIQPRAVAEMSSSALLNNYRAIQDLVPEQQILPMVKANAYGHGIGWASRLLVGLPGIYALGVATLEEGAEVRSALGLKARAVPIVVFSETMPWSDSKGNFCEKYGLTAVITTEEDWRSFVRNKWMSRVAYEVQFNTGMNRLGILPSFARTLAKEIRNLPSSQHPTGVFSHLAMSEAPDAKLSVTQMERFLEVKKELAGTVPAARFHLANSGGIWNAKAYGLKDLTDVVRPGISLYGIPPWSGAPQRGLLPVLTLKLGVLTVHRLKPGESIGYGGTFKVSGTQPIYAAILGGGYADGVKRSLSNRGYAWLDGKPTRFLGIVSMDLCAVECSPDTQAGSWAELIGPHVDPWGQARAGETIPYELLTSLSARVKRSYDPT